MKNPEKVMDYILRGIDIHLWAQAKQKVTVERKSMREVLFEGLKWYVTPAGTAANIIIILKYS